MDFFEDRVEYVLLLGVKFISLFLVLSKVAKLDTLDYQIFIEDVHSVKNCLLVVQALYLSFFLKLYH